MSPRRAAGLQTEPLTTRSPTAAVVDFKSRAHREEVMAKVMCDERVAQLLDAEQLADLNRMSYGGFETFVSA